jgi:hypothetical protein
MKNVVFTALLAAALMAESTSAQEQTKTMAAAPAASPGPFYKGQVLKAEQSCPRFPGEGLTVTVISVAEGGQNATVMLNIKCWGTTWMRTGSFPGSIWAGNPARLLFTNGFGYGAEMTGSWKLDNGKPVFTFSSTKLGQGYVNPPLWTDSVVLR